MTVSTAIKAIQDIMRKDAGVDGDAQRLSQLGWMLFLKIFDDQEKELEATQDGFRSPVPKRFRWREWAANDEGITGDPLSGFINNELFPALKNLQAGAGNPRGQVVRAVFEDSFNYMKNGTLLRQVVNKINEIDFNSSEDRHLFGDIYEQILKDLQAAGNSGEYYTPRAVTRFMVDRVDPQLGEKILDPACGTGGFLANAIEHVRDKYVKNVRNDRKLQESINGVEKKQMPHLLCVTNMLLHGIEVPSNIKRDNTLAKPLIQYGPADRVDVVITNPPFGGMEEDGVELNFPGTYRTKETADLFLVLIVTLLKNGGRGAIVLPDGTLFGEGVKTRIKEMFLTECNLHTIVRLPNGVFNPYTNIKTNLLFFTKGEPTKTIWYYEHAYPEGEVSYNKTRPIVFEEFTPEIKWWNKRKENEFAWKVDIKAIKESNYNLDIKNPNVEAAKHRDPEELLAEYKGMEYEVINVRGKLKKELMDSLLITIHDKELKKNWKNIIENFDFLYNDLENLQNLRKAILQLAIQGKLVEQINEIEPASVFLKKLNKQFPPVKTNEIPFELPKGWAWERLGNICSYLQRGKSPEYIEKGEYPVISQKCIQWSGFDISRARFINPSSLEKYEEERFLKSGDLLWNSTGDGTIGRVNIYSDENHSFKKVVADSHVTILRLNGLEAKFIFTYLASPFIQNKISELSSGTTKQTELNTSTIRMLPVPIAPLDEQKRIIVKVERLQTLCDELEKKYSARSKTLGKLAESLLQI